MLWSTVEKTALADAEVEYKDHKSDTIYSAFSVKKSNLKDLEGADVLIWTTTPWTIPANKALAYNRNLDYSLLKIESLEFFNETKIIVASKLIENIVKSCGIKKFEILKEFQGDELKKTICSNPFKKLNFDALKKQEFPRPTYRQVNVRLQ